MQNKLFHNPWGTVASVYLIKQCVEENSLLACIHASKQIGVCVTIQIYVV